ncbi:MAG: porin family protein [Bacteroidota bacterium]
MKKSVLLIAVAFFGITAVSAQESVIFGAKGGVNFSNMSSDGFDENNSRTGFHLGLLAEVPLTDRISLQPEVLYSTQGTEARRMVGGTSYLGEYNLDYIQVPVLAKIYLIEGLSLEVGPSFNFLTKEESKLTAGSVTTTSETDYGSSFEFGGALGATYKVRGGFFGSARYTQGFTDAFDSDNWDGDAVKNNGFQLGVGMMF